MHLGVQRAETYTCFWPALRTVGICFSVSLSFPVSSLHARTALHSREEERQRERTRKRRQGFGKSFFQRAGNVIKFSTLRFHCELSSDLDVLMKPA